MSNTHPQEEQCDEPTPSEASFPDLFLPEMPAKSTLPDSNESDSENEMQIKKCTTPQGVESFVNQEFASMQVLQDV